MNVMMKWWKKLTKNQKGFSLVELLCTIAIFSIVITSVGTVMVVSARSYQNGNVELDLQQQAQITSNLLTNLIIDSDEVVQASGDTLTVRKVESGVTVTYQIYYSSGDNTIYYTSSADAASTPRVLAEYVSGFTVNQDAGGNVDFALKFTENSRNYESDYHVTPRNGVTSGGAVTAGTASLFVENELTLEPGQEYDLNVRVLGTSIQGFSVSATTGNTDTTDTTVTVKDTNTVHIKVGLGETSESFQFSVQPTDSSIAPMPVTVFVRRVKAINMCPDNQYRLSGTANKAGAEYKVTATLAGSNLPRVAGAWYDVDYVDPYTVDWAYEFTKKDSDGNSIVVPAGDYIQETGRGMDVNNVPYITFKLKQDLTEGCSLKVTTTALHPEGEYPVDSGNKTNKTGLKYDTVQGFWTLEYQAWRRNGRLDIGLALDDSYFWPPTETNPNKSFKGNAEVNVWGYSKNNVLVDHPTGFNYFATTDSGSFVKAEPGYGDSNNWHLRLDVDRTRDTMAYSSPYFAYSQPQTGYWSDIVRYDVTINYHIYHDEHAGEDVTLTSSHSIEDVQIKFKNVAALEWNRTNKVYVTTSDSIDDYKVYFMFDKGWEGTEYSFSHLDRFVGVVYDDANDMLDIRKDIPILRQDSDSDGRYIIFSLPYTEKEACKAITESYGGIIKEIYEYNPYFGRIESYGGPVLYYPTDTMTGTQVTSADLAAVKGCAGTVEFHFVEPNISGNTAALKVMYCPTPTEFSALGNVYYVGGTDASGNDVKIKIVCGGNVATYQEEVGGVVTTTVGLTWNGTGWTAS